MVGNFFAYDDVCQACSFHMWGFHDTGVKIRRTGAVSACSWWILFAGREKLVEVDIVKSLSDMTAVFMAGGAHELLKENSNDFLDNVLRVGRLFYPFNDRWLWDVATMLKVDLPRTLMEYLRTHGGTASFIAIAVNAVRRMYEMRV